MTDLASIRLMSFRMCVYGPFLCLLVDVLGYVGRMVI